MILVLYMGGTCGDLVTSVIDYTGSKFMDTRMDMDMKRCQLKKPHLFKSDIEKDQYIDSMQHTYLSLPSHDTPYHIERRHDFISISVQDMPTAIWAATRFKNLHKPRVWQEMQSYCGAITVEDYAERLVHYSNMIKDHTTKIINLKDIIEGNLINELSKYVKTPLSRNLYTNWLSLQNNTFLL